ncbi:TIGR02452 family protein [Actinocorallia longicatena]|uniref:TIGR02452 family protein n=1 Tax=Actinocorallia longicatena TaxID=111803 RepID=A0ABP6QBE4_9ACTN
MSRNPRKSIAKETVAIMEAGHYTAGGRTVEIAAALAECVKGTRLYRPGDFPEPSSADRHATVITVTDETTTQATERLRGDVLALNFASAKNPGGGFLRGAHAQEESLARSSGLYASLRSVPEFYAFHREQGDLLYSDHMIYSPGVPVFRDDSGALLPEAYPVSFVTSAAPNRGALRDTRTTIRDGSPVAAALEQRAEKVLALALAEGHRRLVLGAWGCGVFMNDPREVALIFADLLGGAYRGRFADVVFAVPDSPGRFDWHAAFRDVLAGR